ncbi:thermonuclease family protein [Pseudooceanicola onchidii]|uniref:thermonuclease family protein n=1 Tax=Pseudooceanicola onchidii TaxID=2562279 RepID=UPI001F0E7C36|nr:thermonuclease family protein [Pseudooceanicola onchidii]
MIDGDTIIVKKQRIRLFGIDAPEMEHPWGKKSKWTLIGLCKGKEIRVEPQDQLSYDRIVAKCLLPDGTDLSAEMVRRGMAIDWPKFSGGVYLQFEPEGVRKRHWRADARQKGRQDLWSTPYDPSARKRSGATTDRDPRPS